VSTREPLAAAPSAQFRRKPIVESAGERFRSAPLAPWARAWARRVYHAALMLQTGGRGLASHLPGGEVVHVLPSYRYLSWNPIEYAAFKKAVTAGATALDVGANVGAYAMLLGQWVGPAGRVYAFEPAPEVFQGLTGHVRLNGLQGVVHPVASAVGERDGAAQLMMSPTAGEARLAADGERFGPTIDVPTVTIDTFCDRHHLTPDFIKIDVEGWELSALRGARRTIARRRDLELFVELHPSIWPLIGVTREAILGELALQDLEPVPLQPGADFWSQEGLAVALRRRGGR
jgi:FkbM family methyltransferase